jgi:UDP-GlcNAc:undecaprenyl-phosphate GlcNAc-1-phosphate transferase
MLTYITVSALALLLSLALTPIVRFAAIRFDAVDPPDRRRKLHRRAIPTLGGLAVVGAFAGALWTLPYLPDSPAAADGSRLGASLLLPATLVLLVGILDDLRPVPPMVKVLAQLGAGLWAMTLVNLRLAGIDPAEAGTLAHAAMMIGTAAWIVIVSNAFNLVDGMDGLAAGVSSIASVSIALVAIQHGNFDVAIVATALAGSVVGFLKYNFNPATIFLGDSGSLFLGFMFAVLSITGPQSHSPVVAIVASAGIVGVPLLETAASILRRFVRGRSVLRPDRGHIHHQLMRLGLTPARAALLIYTAAGLLGATSLMIVRADEPAIAIAAVVVVSVTGAWMAIQRLGYAEFVEINSALKRGFVYQRRIIRNAIVARKLGDDLRRVRSLEAIERRLSDVTAQMGFSRVELSLIGGASGTQRASRRCTDERSSRAPGWEGRVESLVTHSALSVALGGSAGPIGYVRLWRPRSGPPLYSELASLITTIETAVPAAIEALRLQHVAEASAEVPAAEQSRLGVDMQTVASAPSLRLLCPSCHAAGLHRRRARTLLAMVRRGLTSKRPYRCSSCGWNKWTAPSLLAAEQVILLEPGAPDLHSIDSAVASTRWLDDVLLHRWTFSDSH